MKPRREYTPHQPGGESKRLGTGLTPELVAPWGFVVGKRVELIAQRGLPTQDNPFRVVVSGFRSDKVEFGIIVESEVSHKKYIVVPKDGMSIEKVIPCSEAEYGRALEYEEPPAGEKIAIKVDKK